MGALSLTNGALLGGLALLAAPVIAHLLQRRARRPIVFPTIAFLQQCAAQHSKLHRLKRLTLLSLRMLAVAAIVMAFTRPTWLSPGLAAQRDREASAAVVFVLDASVSTTQRTRGQGVLFDQLKAAVQAATAKLRSGEDLANVVFADQDPRPLFPKLTANLAAIEPELSRIRATSGRADFAMALAEAGRQLEGHSGVRRVVVVSDFQLSNWSEVLADERFGSVLPAGTSVTLARLSEDPPANLGLSSPDCFPAIPSEGQTVDLSVNIENGLDAAQQVTIVVEVAAVGGGEVVTREQMVSLEPRESRRATFSAALPAGAMHAVKFRLRNPDGLEADNESTMVIGAAQPTPVLVLSDDPIDEPGTAAFYLMRALAPFEGLNDVRGSNRLAVRHVLGSQLQPRDLEGVEAVFLGYLGVLREETARLLVEYVRNGGGVVQFCGDGPVQQNVDLLNKLSDGLIAPWQLAVRQSVGRAGDPIQITSGRWQSKWFREFDERSQLAFREIGFRSVWAGSAAAADAEVLLMFSNGQPALGGRAFGRGQFLMANFSPESTSSDLGKQGSFVAMMQIMAATLHRVTADRSDTTVGGSLRFPGLLPVEAAWTVEAPDGTNVTAVRIEKEGGGEIVLNRADVPGIYRLLNRGESVSAAAVHIDPREIDLRPIETESIEQRLGRAQIASESTTGRASLAGAIDVQGRPLWGEMFSLALAAIALELFLLGLWRR